MVNLKEKYSGSDLKIQEPSYQKNVFNNRKRLLNFILPKAEFLRPKKIIFTTVIFLY